MLRRVLSVYLAFLTVAAPSLCCCTAARAVAAVSERPAESQPACCCHEETPPTDSAPAPLPPVPESQDRCPCRQHAEKQALAGQTADLNLLRTVLHALSFDRFAFVPTLPGPALAADGMRPFDWHEPFLLSADLLFVHHRLRC